MYLSVKFSVSNVKQKKKSISHLNFLPLKGNTSSLNGKSSISMELYINYKVLARSL